MTGDDATLSDDGWYDQLELALCEQDGWCDNCPAKYFGDEHDYDYNNMPDNLKTSKQAAYLYAVHHQYNKIVKDSEILADKSIVMEIMNHYYQSEHFTNMFKHLPDNIKNNPEIKAYVFKRLGIDAFKTLGISKTDPALLDDRMIEGIASYYTLLRDIPFVRNCKAKERRVLLGLIKRNQKTNNPNIENLTNDEIRKEIKSLLKEWYKCALTELPDYMLDDEEIIMANSCGIAYASDRLKNDTEFIKKFCHTYPRMAEQYPYLFDGDIDLLLAYLRDPDCRLSKHSKQFKAIWDIIQKNKYLNNKNLRIELIQHDLWSLEYEKPCDDKDLALTAMEIVQNRQTEWHKQHREYQFLSDKLKHDTDIMVEIETKPCLSEWVYAVPDDLTTWAQGIILKTDDLGYIATWSDLPDKFLTEDIAAHLVNLHYQTFGQHDLTLLTMPKKITPTNRLIQKLLDETIKSCHKNYNFGQANGLFLEIIQARPDLKNSDMLKNALDKYNAEIERSNVAMKEREDDYFKFQEIEKLII